MGRKDFQIEGVKELEKMFKKLGDVPQKTVTPAARKGMNIALKDAKKNAPVDTGELKQGMKLVGERSKAKGKKVYRIVFERSKNDIFQKKNKEGKVVAYYPVSQEYGYFTKNGRYVPGYHFVSNSLNDNNKKIEKTIVEDIGKRIDKVIKG